jgi:hypothetical protein
LPDSTTNRFAPEQQALVFKRPENYRDGIGGQTGYARCLCLAQGTVQAQQMQNQALIYAPDGGEVGSLKRL